MTIERAPTTSAPAANAAPEPITFGIFPGMTGSELFSDATVDPDQRFWSEVARVGGPDFARAVSYVGFDFFPDVFRPVPFDQLRSAVEGVLTHFRTVSLSAGGIPPSVPPQAGIRRVSAADCGARSMISTPLTPVFLRARGQVALFNQRMHLSPDMRRRGHVGCYHVAAVETVAQVL